MKLEEKGWAICGVCGSEWNTNYWLLLGKKMLPTVCPMCDGDKLWKGKCQKEHKETRVRIVRSPLPPEE